MKVSAGWKVVLALLAFLAVVAVFVFAYSSAHQFDKGRYGVSVASDGTLVVETLPCREVPPIGRAKATLLTAEGAEIESVATELAVGHGGAHVVSLSGDASSGYETAGGLGPGDYPEGTRLRLDELTGTGGELFKPDIPEWKVEDLRPGFVSTGDDERVPRAEWDACA